ncbi:MAG: CCA tRNA nucleotidyltransferase, partial [Deltaproteobacteria bacterium]
MKQVARQARCGDVRVYLVGGAVRDLLLRRPIRDLDVAVEGKLEPLARRCGTTLRSHRAFGTATVQPVEGVAVDLARTRRERYPR